MKILPTALAAYLVALAVAASAWAQSNALVTLKPEAVIAGPTVHLGDLFDGLENLGGIAATPVARAPTLGASVDLDAHWLSALARTYGLAWRPQSQFDRIRVERAARIVDNHEIERLLQDALRQQGGNSEITLLLDNPNQRILLPAEMEGGMTVTNLSHDPRNGRFIALLAANARGSAEVQAKITGRAIEMAEVPVLSRRMVPGEIVGEDDIEWMAVPADRIARNVVVNQVNIVGMTPRRPVRAGEQLRSGEFQAPIVVAKNNLVSVHLRTERLRLTAQGRALEDGSMGEVIRVMNTASNTVINAVVVAAGKVQVIQASIAATE